MPLYHSFHSLSTLAGTSMRPICSAGAIPAFAIAGVTAFGWIIE